MQANSEDNKEINTFHHQIVLNFQLAIMQNNSLQKLRVSFTFQIRYLAFWKGGGKNIVDGIHKEKV